MRQRPQQGFVVLLMLVLIAVGVFGAMAAWVSSDPPPSKQSINRQVLAQAKEALLAYVAVSGTPVNMSTVKTRLPCPDRDGDGVADVNKDIDGDGKADANDCGALRQTMVGLLPWSTLGLPPLRDADGECLWYAVSGDFKDTEAPGTAIVVNADNDGVITVTNEAGQNLATQLVAVVFAPGAKLGSQVRTNSTALSTDKPCATPTGSAAGDVAGYLDSGKIDIRVTPPTITFMQLTGTVDKQSVLNDQLAWITTEEYAAIATQRNVEVLKKAVAAAVSASGAGGRMPFAADTPGGACLPGQYSGFLPVTCPYVNTATGTALTFSFDIHAPDDWPKLAFYAVAPGCAFDAVTCDTTSPLALASALTVRVNSQAKAVMLIRGRRQSGEDCPLSNPSATTPALDQWLLCIESKFNRDALRNPTVSQKRTFVAPDKRPISNDVLQELP